MTSLPAIAEHVAKDVIVRADGLGVSYDGHAALCDVDLAIARGRVTALIGPSGCGKTTFLNCLNRMTDLIPGCRVQGSVRVDDVQITNGATDLVALRRSVGMIFQKPNPFPLSIRANLHLPLREHGVRDRGKRDAIAERVLEEVGLLEEVRDRLDRPALALSGGQQQRLCIARALTLRPRLLLLDEPCSALDPMATDRVEELIRAMRGQYTIVIVTHNLGQARRLADDVHVFWSRGTCGGRCGRVIESGPAEEIFARPRDPDATAYVQGLRG